jgi:hypothetical protein
VTRRSTWTVVAAVALVVLLVVLVSGPGEDGGLPRHPDSTSPDGAKALVLLLDRLGADVRVGDTAVGADVALLLDDRLSDVEHGDLVDWVNAGGRLVVADPESTLTPVVSEGAEGLRTRAECTVAALDGIDAIDVGSGALYDLRGEPSGSCFGDDDKAFLVADDRGEGTLVSLGGADVFLNERLDDGDNAVLAGALLAPTPGTRVVFLQPAEPGEGDESLLELISPGVQRAVLQLAVAFLVYALWRARRLGRPVEEPQPVEIAGSELVEAVGQLLQQRRDPGGATLTLQHDIRRALAGRVGLPADAPTTALADAIAARTGVDREAVFAALSAPPAADDRQLVALAAHIDAVRQEVLHGQR